MQIATELNQLRSGCHRTLHELIGYGYVRQLPQRGDYALTTKMASMGLSFLSKSGVVDIAQPVINRLAQVTEELVRLAIVDGERLTLVAKAQGARSGLLYDPDMGIDLRLSCSAAGQAWLMTLPEDLAIEYVTRQGIGDPQALRAQRADQHQGAAQGAGRAPQARLQHHPGRLCARHELDGSAGAEGGRAGHGRDRRRRAFDAAHAGAHEAVRPAPEGGGRGAGGVRPCLAAAQGRQRRHLGQPGRQAQACARIGSSR